MIEIGLFLIGIFAGLINTMAGGGSFLTIPLLIFMGLSPTVANATNRLGVFLQSLVGVSRFHSYEVFPAKFSMIIAIPATLGGLIGAYLATIVSDASFKKYLALMMIIVTFISIIKPFKKPEGEKEISISKQKWIFLFIIFFFIGIYGGFIQAGVGFFILAGMSLTGYNLVASNAAKMFIILIFTGFALVIFILGGKVNFLLGFILGCGNIVGTLIGTKVTVKKGHDFIQKIVVVCVIIFAIKLLIF
jgi:uncharacterized membrane protein YfcA